MLAAGERRWRDAGLDPSQVQAMVRPDPAALANANRWLARPGRCLLGWDQPDYPELLGQIAAPPLALFVEGDPALLWHPGVAVVGSRAATAGGRDHAATFACALVAAGLSVVSGMAAGIDGAAHEAALACGGITVAVLGTGPDVAYPRRHAGLRARIAERGAVVSEHLPGTSALRSHFPSRNRILAGLSLATLVVEAAQRSGALITARQAAESGREVFAIPGSIHNPMARGCHRLIRDGACLVQDPGQVLEALGPMARQLGLALRERLQTATPGPAQRPGKAEGAPDPDYNPLWQALGHDPTGMDLLAERTGLTTARLSSMLLVMELDGRVAVEHGRYWRRS